jgi:GNAT superfamily N-acetyltransferase
MALVVQLTRKLAERPVPHEVAGIHLRNYAGPPDIETWLDLRRRAFARQKLGIGNWDAADFAREFLSKPWWRPEAMWLAEAQGVLMPAGVVGTVTLARRGAPPHARPVVHWLCVAPGHRRGGIGRLLLATLEAAVWDAGQRQVWLETHTAWSEALRLYESAGYVPANAEESPGEAGR